jgi:hypothetical protein
MEQEILEVAQKLAINNELSCPDAHAIAAKFGITPQELGHIITQRSAVRFSRCQLGLFGYGPKSEGKSKIVQKAIHVPQEIREAAEAKAKDGRISCLATWELADQFKYPRLGMVNIIEAMGLKVAPCQLGCF